MKREYPEIFNCQQENHGYLFIPDTFIYEELTAKVKTIYFGMVGLAIFLVFKKWYLFASIENSLQFIFLNQ